MWVFSLAESHESMQVKRPSISTALGIGRATQSERQFVSRVKDETKARLPLALDGRMHCRVERTNCMGWEESYG